MKLYYLLFFLLLIPVASSLGDGSGPLSIIVEDVIYREKVDNFGTGNLFELEVVLNIWNPTNNNITVTNPDTCQFKAKVAEINGSADVKDYFPYLCGQAVTQSILTPGLSIFTTALVIEVISGNTNEFPPGQFYIVPVVSDDAFGSFAGAWVEFVDGKLLVNQDDLPDGYGEMETVILNFERVDVGIQFLPVMISLILIPYILKNKK